MAIGVHQGPPEQKRRDEALSSFYYPDAHLDMQIVFENYDAPKNALALRARPIAVSVVRNTYNKADTWQVTFDAKDLPLTPESVVTGNIDIFLYNKLRVLDDVAQTANLVGPLGSAEDELFRIGLKPVVSGIFDDFTVDYSDQGRFATITGTDFTSLYTGRPWPVDKRIKANNTVKQAIQILMDEVDTGNRHSINLVVEPNDLSTPVASSQALKTSKKQIKPAAKNYWDAMYEMAIRYGFILFVRGRDVVLTKPKTFEEGKTEYKRLQWGSDFGNLLSIRSSRRMGRQTTPIIRAIAYNDKSRKRIVEEFPPKNSTLRRLLEAKVIGVNVPKNEILEVVLRGINSKSVLKEAAESLYTLKARGEQTLQIETRSLTDSQGNNLLEIQTGDAMYLSLDPAFSDFLEVKSSEERKAILRNYGITNEKILQEVATAIENTNNFRRPFRVKEATFDWGIDSGLAISMNLQNFVNISRQKP